MQGVQADEDVSLQHLFSGFAKGRDFVIANIFIGFEVLLKAVEIWLYYVFGQLLADDMSGIVLLAFAILGAALIRIVISGTISLFGEYWRVSIVKSVLDQGVHVLRDRPDVYPERTMRHERPTAIASSSYLTSENLVSLYLSLVRSGFGLAAYIVAFALLFGAGLSLAFLAGLVFSFMLNRRVEPYLAKRASRTETARIKVTSLYDTAWDNLVIGNSLWTGKWIRRLDDTYRRYRFLNNMMCRRIYVIQLIHILVSYGLTVTVFVWLLLSSRPDMALTLSLVVVVPKIIQGLQQQSDFIAHISVLGVLKGQLEIIRDALSPLERQDLSLRMDEGKIKILSGQDGKEGLAAFFERLDEKGQLSQVGQRMTIRGANGSGKTSLLLMLKERFGSLSFYLPAGMKTTMSGSDIRHSTGEYVMKTLHEALTASNRPRFFLLDEWDANLDGNNAREIDRLLDLACLDGTTIIEVRHRNRDDRVNE